MSIKYLINKTIVYAKGFVDDNGDRFMNITALDIDKTSSWRWKDLTK